MECKDSFGRLLSKNFTKTFYTATTNVNLCQGITFFDVLKSIKMMDEGKFNRLTLDDRAKLLWEKGDFVESITYHNYCLILYSLNRQFVELFYDRSSQTILWISLANEYDMKKYLGKIEIPVL
jgi:hypothetical protein